MTHSIGAEKIRYAAHIMPRGLLSKIRNKNMSLKGRNFLTLLDFTPDEVTELIDLAVDLKSNTA